ncbi:hypothetical protein [Tropicibacter sp. R16_0]|uniref:hypothetical protein n=1 Tax=Tropicibacter sp. R16_0 TaxID=2821102 RepID=UPI001ADB817C|nr:hypothetical protein [Tropicibacter sp. R16_0]
MYAENQPRGQYLKPPEHLSIEEFTVFQQIVRSNLPDHFNEAHLHLLVRYVDLVLELRRLGEWQSKIIAEQGVEALFYETDTGQKKEHPSWARMQHMSSEMQALASTLKILPDRVKATEARKAAVRRKRLDEMAEENPDTKGLLYNGEATRFDA